MEKNCPIKNLTECSDKTLDPSEASKQISNFPLVAPLSNSLYVGDLSPNVDEKNLFRLFSRVGEIESIKVFRNVPKGKTLGYCYINFKSSNIARCALEILNFYCDPKTFLEPIRIMWNNPDDTLRKSGDGNLFVKNLPKDFGSKALFEIFSPFGKILSCKIASDEDGFSLGYGFVHFENLSDGKEALKSLNGVTISKKKIFVGPFIKKEQRGKKAQSQFTNVYVKNLDLEKCTHERVMDIFEVFGEITSIFIPKKKEKPLGFIFVNFALPEDAEEAVFNMNNKKIGKNFLYVGKAENKLERQRILKKNFSQKKKKQEKKVIKKKFFIRNIPDQMEKKSFLPILSKFGELSYLNFLKKREMVSMNLLLITFKKCKFTKFFFKPKNFEIKSKVFKIEGGKKTVLRLKQFKTVFLKKNLEIRCSREKSCQEKKKSKSKLHCQKKFFFFILKTFFGKQQKFILSFFFWIFIKKLKRVGKNKEKKLKDLPVPCIRFFFHLFFCRKEGEKNFRL